MSTIDEKIYAQQRAFDTLKLRHLIGPKELEQLLKLQYEKEQPRNQPMSTNQDQTKIAQAAGLEPYPCPFCGGLAKVSESANVWRAGCPQCDIETFGFFDREDAVERWNQRSGWDNKAVGGCMREERERRRLSIRAMAKRMGCSAPYVSDLEKGRRTWTPNTLDWYRGSLPPNPH